MRRAGLYLVLMFLGAGTLMGQVPVPAPTPQDAWSAPQSSGKAPNVGSVQQGKKVIASTTIPPKPPQQPPTPRVETPKPAPATVPQPPVRSPAQHPLESVAVPIPSDGLEQITVHATPKLQQPPAQSNVVPIVAERKEPMPLRLNQVSEPQQPAPPVETVKGSPPGVIIEKTGPESHNAGQPFRYEIVIRNPGATPLANVRLEEALPQGVRCLSVDPQPETHGQTLIWDLGSLDGHGEKKITVEVQQETEGEFRSTATAMVVAHPWRMKVTRPELTVTKKGPETAQFGDEVAFEIQVANPGNGPATHVLIHDRLPPGLQHPQGSDIEADLGTLEPGQTRTITLKATAIETGLQVNEVTVTADGGLNASARAGVLVTRPGLKVKKTGPEVTYLHHDLEHRLEVHNNGQAPATSVRLTDTLPEGLEFLAASDGANHDPKTRTVEWTIGTLAPGQNKVVSIQMKAKASGDWINQATARADRGLESTASAPVHVEGVPAMLLEVVDIDDPLEVGAETDYEIRVINQGTSPVAQVSIRAVLPEGLEFVLAEGPSGHRTQGNEVLFDPLEKLAARADALYRVRVKARKEGDWRFKVFLNSTALTRPVFEEESTGVYDDNRKANPATPPVPALTGGPALPDP